MVPEPDPVLGGVAALSALVGGAEVSGPVRHVAAEIVGVARRVAPRVLAWPAAAATVAACVDDARMVLGVYVRLPVPYATTRPISAEGATAQDVTLARLEEIAGHLRAVAEAVAARDATALLTTAETVHARYAIGWEPPPVVEPTVHVVPARRRLDPVVAGVGVLCALVLTVGARACAPDTPPPAVPPATSQGTR